MMVDAHSGAEIAEDEEQSLLWDLTDDRAEVVENLSLTSAAEVSVAAYAPKTDLSR
jgi:hypothetical protein